MVPTFSDWQISRTFPWHLQYFFLLFSSNFSVLFNEFNKYKNLFHKYKIKQHFFDFLDYVTHRFEKLGFEKEKGFGDPVLRNVYDSNYDGCWNTSTSQIN